MADPSFHSLLFKAYLAVIVLMLVMPTVRRRLRWWRECAALRKAIVEQWGPASGPIGAAEALARARNQVEALIPCRVRSQGRSPVDAWICCARDQFLILSPGTVLDVAYGGIRRLALADTSRGRSLTFSIEAGDQRWVAEVVRIDDLVRLINVAVKHAVPVGYLRP